MADIEEVLALDVAPALASIDDLGTRIEAVALDAGRSLSEALSLGIRNGLADITPLEVPVDLAGIDAVKADLSSLDGFVAPLDLTVNDDQVISAIDNIGSLADTGVPPIDLTVNSSEIDTANAALGDLGTSAESVPPVNIAVDDSQVIEATSNVEGLTAASQDASQTGIDVAVTGTDGLDQTSASAERLTASSGAADAAAGGLAARVQGLGPSGIAGAAGIAAIGFGVDEFVKSGQRSLEGTNRLNRAFGEQADAVQKINVGGLDTDLKSLAISTGSSAAGLKIAVANFAELGKATGATSAETVSAGKNYLALANYIAATRPEMGGAEEVTRKLGTALRQGGRAALALGLPLNSAKEIAAAAAEKFGVAEASLSTFQKQSAALDLVMGRLGPSFKTNLDEGLQSPIVQLRSVEAQLKAVIAEAGREITPKFISALKDAEPVVDSLVKSLGGIAIGGIDALSGGLAALSPLLEGIAGILTAIPTPLLEVGGGMLVVSKAATLLNGPVTRLLSGLGSLAERGGATAAAATLRKLADAEVAATVATETETVATEAQVVAHEANAVAAGEDAVAMQAAATANTEASASSVGAIRGIAKGTGAAIGDAVAAINPLTAALVAAAAGYLIYKSNAEDTEKVQRVATDAADAYAKSIDSSGAALAALDPSKARAAFASSTTLVEDFRKVLTDQGIDATVFDRAGVSAQQLSLALTGSRKDLQATFEDLDRIGKFSESNGSKAERFGGNLLGQQGLTDTLGITKQSGLSDQAEALRINAVALKKKQDAERASAEQSLKANKITDESAIRNGLATGSLDRLTAKQRIRLGALLDEKAATEDAAKAEIVLGDAYTTALSKADPAQQKLIEGAQRAAAAIEAGGKADPGDLGLARTLAASDGYANLDPTVKDANDKLLSNVDATSKAAAANGQLLDSNGLLTTSFVDLNSQLDTAVSRYESIRGATAGLARAGRDAENASNDVVAAIEANGTSIDDTGAQFDAASVTVDNYSQVLAKLPKDVQLRINAIGEGSDNRESDAKISEVTKVWQHLQDIGRVPAELKIADINSANVDEFIGKLPPDVADGIKIKTKFAPIPKGDVEAQKAAATRAAVAAQPDKSKLNPLATDGAAAVVDAFDTAGTKIAAYAGEQLKAGIAVDDVKAKIREQRDELAKKAVQEFVDKGDSLKVATDKVNLLLIREHLLDPQIDQDFKASGLELIGTQLEKMNLLLLTIAGVIDKQTLAEILSIPDAQDQTAALQAALDKVTDPGKKAIVTAVLNSDPATSALDALTSKAYTVKIDAVLNSTPDFRAQLNGTAGAPGQTSAATPALTAPTAPPAPPTRSRGEGAFAGLTGTRTGPTAAQIANVQAAQTTEINQLKLSPDPAKVNFIPTLRAMTPQQYADYKKLLNGGVSAFPGFRKGGRPKKDEPVIVGEDRPEVFVPDVAGTIVPSVSESLNRPQSVPDLGALTATPPDLSPLAPRAPLSAPFLSPREVGKVGATASEIRLDGVEKLLGDLLVAVRTATPPATVTTTTIGSIVAPTPVAAGNAVIRAQAAAARRRSTT